jgi:transcriptional regulator with XRE-family HTH domain
MSSQKGHGFDEWLRTQLKTRKMSQRQLAIQAGVDHSTISRLVRGDRVPSLETATKLARGLREIHPDADSTRYLGLVTADAISPTARIEYALRADDSLVESQVRRIMEYYLAVRRQSTGIPTQPANGAGSSHAAANGPAVGNGHAAANGRGSSSGDGPGHVSAFGVRPSATYGPNANGYRPNSPLEDDHEAVTSGVGTGSATRSSRSRGHTDSRGLHRAERDT